MVIHWLSIDRLTKNDRQDDVRMLDNDRNKAPLTSTTETIYSLWSIDPIVGAQDDNQGRIQIIWGHVKE